MSSLIARIVATSIFACAATAASAETFTFSRDGQSYVAKVTQQADGSVTIKGHELYTGKRFRLHVKGEQVSGRYGSAGVSFQTPVAPTLLSSR